MVDSDPLHLQSRLRLRSPACPTLPYPTLPLLPCPALPCPALPCPALSCPALPGVDLTCPSSAGGSAAADAADRALASVLSRQLADHGWGPETSKAVIAVSLANSTALDTVERELTLKQLQINFLVDMWG